MVNTWLCLRPGGEGEERCYITSLAQKDGMWATKKCLLIGRGKGIDSPSNQINLLTELQEY